MRWVAAGLAFAFMFAGSVQAQLPSSQQLRSELDGKLLKPLPRVQAIVGIGIPPPAPLLVVASFSDDQATALGDRGYAIGRALNDLLFGADARLDVEAPSFYFTDVLDVAVPTGGRRDSGANALRVAVRESAQWCVYGHVRGSTPAVIETFVSRCGERAPSPTAQVAVDREAQWPQAMRSVCEAVLAAVGIAKVGSPTQGCRRALDFQPGSIIAYAKYVVPGKYGTTLALEPIVRADPAFTPALLEMLWRLPYDGNKDAFLAQVRKLTALARSSPAATLVGLSRQLELTGWKIGHHPYDELHALIRAHPQLRAIWITLASRLSEGSTHDHPPGGPREPAGLNEIRRGYYPNEATHSAALSLSLALYANWPHGYRSHWQMGYALLRYAWMLRGGDFWREVPPLGRKAFIPLLRTADRFIAVASDANPTVAALWVNRIETSRHIEGDWRAVLEQAVATHPQHQALYESAMAYAQDVWGGTEADRHWIERLAIRNNPGATWPHMLRGRSLPRGTRPVS
jgi:hypothetical protein